MENKKQLVYNIQNEQNQNPIEKQKIKKSKKQKNKPFNYDFLAEIQNLDKSLLEKRLNIPRLYEIPKELLIKPKPKVIIGNITRIETAITHPEQFYNKNSFIAGWQKTIRIQGGGSEIMLELNDGSSLKGLKIIIYNSIQNFEQIKNCFKDSSFKIYGQFVQSQNKQGQEIQMVVNKPYHKVEILGPQTDKQYPMPMEKRDLLHISKENMREQAHLRPRCRFFSCIQRVRNNLSYATHIFFQSNAFQQVYTPIITNSDYIQDYNFTFQVTTLFSEKGKSLPIAKVLKTKEGEIDFKQDFFKKPTYLSTSGQFSLESYSTALSNVYTFSPAFRAETASSNKHLSEFWMIQAELAFSDNIDNMDCAEAYLKFCLQYILDNNAEDLAFLEEYQQKEWEQKYKQYKSDKLQEPPTLLKQYLKSIIDIPFERITYNDAIIILQKAVQEGKVFECDPNPTWDSGLSFDHEQFLCDYVFKKPICIYNYPEQISPFYSRQNEDKNTAASFNIIFPYGLRDLVKGSQREERLEVIEQKMEELGLEKQQYWWYLQLREYGTIPHAGFKLSLERLVMLATGTQNIRDVIPFPRQPSYAQF